MVFRTWRSDCAPGVRFQLRDDVAGVTCINREAYFYYSTCDAIEVTNTSLRVRAVMQDTHPGTYNFMSFVEILPACEQSCRDDQLRCEATEACWDSARDHCTYCLGADSDVCACWTPDGFEPDGGECYVTISGDSSIGGTCERGTCITPYVEVYSSGIGSPSSRPSRSPPGPSWRRLDR